jgi:hypothetical protein
MSTRTKNAQFAGDEGELRSMTNELVDLHNDHGIPTMWSGVSTMIDHLRDAAGTVRPTSRRTFLVGAGAAVAGGAALMAVGATPGLAGAASLENLAIYAYKAGLAAATAGKLGTVPPAVGTFATTAMRQHTQHAAAWNAVLAQNGKAKVTVTNPALTPTVQAAFAKVTDITGLAQLALMLESAAAATYQAETSMLKSKAAIGLSASIEPVEMQHIAILYYVMGMYPGAQTSAGSPIAFSSTASAA